MAWWREQSQTEPPAQSRSAVAYYRHSAQIGQENSVEIQQDNVRAFAAKHSLCLVHEFADRGKSGLNAEGRPAFNEMMEWVRSRDDFQFILVLDVTRWGRFQDMDLSAHYESLCTQHGKQVIYTHIGMPKEEDLLINHLRKSIDRYQSAEYSRALSKKVFEGCAKVASQGYRPGGAAPYGFHRLMLDEQKQPDRILEPGQRKAIQNGRVVLTPGDEAQVRVILEVFALFVHQEYTEKQIAGLLNQRGVPSPGGVQWSASGVRRILTNQQYAGAVVYNRTTQRLKTQTRRNPRESWVVTPEAYDPIVPPDLYTQAQAIFERRKRRHGRAEMLARLQKLYARYGVITKPLLRADPEGPPPCRYAREFGALTGTRKAVFDEIHAAAQAKVVEALQRTATSVTPHEDFLVVDDLFTLLIQPSVPLHVGYQSAWAFRPDPRAVVDITLGVALAGEESAEPLGYLAFPRLLSPSRWIRVSTASEERLRMQGYSGLELVCDLLE